MSVNSVSNNSSWISQITGASQTRGRRSDNDGDDGVQQAGQGRSGGGLFSAIANALSQIGVGSSSSTASSPSSSSSSASSDSSSSSSQDPAPALGSFMQSLMAALHAQSAQSQGTTSSSAQAGTDSDGDNDGTTSSTQGHGHHRGHLQSDLESLMQKLASSSTASNSLSTTSDSSVSALQQSFQNLMGAVGDTSSNATLSNFLTALSGQFSGASTTGNVVKTSV